MITDEKDFISPGLQTGEELGSVVISDTFEEADCAWCVQNLSYCSVSDSGLTIPDPWMC